MTYQPVELVTGPSVHLDGREQGRALAHLPQPLPHDVARGLWHGASWTFVIGGAFHGLLLVAYRVGGDGHEPGPRLSLRGLGVAVVFLALTCFGWLIFRAESLEQLITFAQALVTPRLGEVPLGTTFRLGFFVAPMIAIDLARVQTGSLEPWTRASGPARAILTALLFYGIVLFGTPYSVEFLYLQF